MTEGLNSFSGSEVRAILDYLRQSSPRRGRRARMKSVVLGASLSTMLRMVPLSQEGEDQALSSHSTISSAASTAVMPVVSTTISACSGAS